MEQNEFHDFQFHSGDITSIKISSDLKYIYTSSRDSTIQIHKITEVADGIDGFSSNEDRKRRKGEAARLKPHNIMDSLTMTFRSAIKDKLAIIMKLKDERKNIEDMGREKEETLRKDHEAAMGMLVEKHKKDLEDERSKFRILQEEFEAECKKAETTRHTLIEENHKIMEALELKQKKEQRAAFDVNGEKIEQLETQKDKFRDKIENIQKYLKEQLDDIAIYGRASQLHEIGLAYQNKYEELKLQHAELLGQIKSDEVNFDEALEQCEWEYEKEIENLNRIADVNLKLAKEKLDELNSEEEKLNKDIKELNKKIVATESKIKDVEDQLEPLYSWTAMDTKVALPKMETQLNMWQDNIQKKEQYLKEMKGKNAMLENIKSVLDHKIAVMKDEKMPMEGQIQSLEKQAKNMYHDLEVEADTQKKILLELQKTTEGLNDAKKEKHQELLKVNRAKHKIEMLQYELIAMMRNPIEDWFPVIARIQKNYFGPDSFPDEMFSDQGSKQDTGIEQAKIRTELIKQKKWLTENLKVVQTSNARRQKEKGIATKVLEKQNKEIIDDSNLLRDDCELLQYKVKCLEDKLRWLNNAIKSVASEGRDASAILKKMIKPVIDDEEDKKLALKRSQLKSSCDTYKQRIGTMTAKKLPKTRRQVSILNFYTKCAKNEEEMSKIAKTARLNQAKMAEQAQELEQLQAKVSAFLRTGDQAGMPPPIKEEKKEEVKEVDQEPSPQDSQLTPQKGSELPKIITPSMDTKETASGTSKGKKRRGDMMNSSGGGGKKEEL